MTYSGFLWDVRGRELGGRLVVNVAVKGNSVDLH